MRILKHFSPNALTSSSLQTNLIRATMLSGSYHLSYCTNIHPAETWAETFAALQTYTLKVRDRLIEERHLTDDQAFAIGLRLSAQAAEELIKPEVLGAFQSWLTQERCYVYTINGFPYGAFHDTRVKEKVYQPDWTTQERLSYTNTLISIIAALCPADSGGSVSTLPGSFKEFGADEDAIFEHLYACARFIENAAKASNKDLHLGLEPEPLGHFENTEETIAFFQRFKTWASQQGHPLECIDAHIGVNFDTCHIALEFDDPIDSLEAFAAAGIRISKIHVSNALEISPAETNALESIKSFDEPTYLHQLILQKQDGTLQRFRDLPEFFASQTEVAAEDIARIHFHIPLYQCPPAPLRSTAQATEAVLQYLKSHPECCQHIEMETYTWGVFPDYIQQDIITQLVSEYSWTLKHG